MGPVFLSFTSTSGRLPSEGTGVVSTTFVTAVTAVSAVGNAVFEGCLKVHGSTVVVGVAVAVAGLSSGGVVMMHSLRCHAPPGEAAAAVTTSASLCCTDELLFGKYVCSDTAGMPSLTVGSGTVAHGASKLSERGRTSFCLGGLLSSGSLTMPRSTAVGSPTARSPRCRENCSDCSGKELSACFEPSCNF